MLVKVISGGQTGADRAGLIAAKAAGLQTGGWMPKGFRALDGYKTNFAAEYCIQEHTSPLYPPRTYANAAGSDGTVRFASDWDSRGEICTLKAINKAKKPYFDVNVLGGVQPAELAAWIVKNKIKTLNVAGNTERTSRGIEEFVIAFLTETFRLVLLEQP